MNKSIEKENDAEQIGNVVAKDDDKDDVMMDSQLETQTQVVDASCENKTTGDDDQIPAQTTSCSEQGNQKEDDKQAKPSASSCPRTEADEEKQNKKMITMNAIVGGEDNTEKTMMSGVVGEPFLDVLEGVQPLPRREVRDETVPGAHAVCAQVPFANPGRFTGLIAGNMRRMIDESIQESEDLEEHILDSSVHIVEDDEETGTGTIQGYHHQREVIEGRVLDEPKDTQNEAQLRGARGWFLILGCAMVGLAVILSLVMLVGPSSAVETDPDSVASPSAASPATTSPAAAPVIHFPPFDNDLPAEVTASITEDKDSAFYKANQWVMLDPSFTSYTPERRRQRFYLAMMYYATNGDSWTDSTNWLSYEVSECHWFSRSSFMPDSKYYEPNTCDDINGTTAVINLSLASNNLTGSWPIFYHDYMPWLRVLDLGNNQVGGALPTFTTTPYLEVYVVSNAAFTGSYVFTAGAYWDNIKVILADGAETRGNNGGAIFHILSPGLEVYNITGMTNDGQLWTDIGMMTSLEYWGRGHSETSGTIPTEIGLLTALKQIDLSSLPYLSGTIPSELGLLTDLTLLDLAETPLTGTVPAQLCDRVHAGLLAMPANCSSLQCC